MFLFRRSAICKPLHEQENRLCLLLTTLYCIRDLCQCVHVGDNIALQMAQNGGHFPLVFRPGTLACGCPQPLAVRHHTVIASSYSLNDLFHPKPDRNRW